MKRKAPLLLMEQLVMVLVFSLAAVLCMQVFALSERISRRNEELDRALLEVQNVAETLKACRGDFEKAARQWGGQWNGQLWGCSWDADWEPTAANQAPRYHMLTAPAERNSSLLGGADVAVYTADGEVLCSLAVSWQEDGR